MTGLPAPTATRRSRQATLRAAGAAGCAVALALALAACRQGDAAMTPAGEALAASAPAVSATHVPPPPAIQAAPSVATPAAAQLASVHAQLDAALGNASACRADADCRSVAVGAKACGGPSGYRAFSAQGTDAGKVADLAQHERDLSATVARESHEVSPCFMLADPGAHCQQNRCVTGPAASH